MAVKGSIAGKLEKQIAEMEVGEEGFVVPWAVSLEKNGLLKYDVYLNTQYTVDNEPHGTVELRIKRTGRGEADFEIDLDSVKNYKWHEGRAIYGGEKEGDVVQIGAISRFLVKYTNS